MEHFDAIIIGFGKGGKLLAADLANRGQQVAIIERSAAMYGGSCINIACIPTKALIHQAQMIKELNLASFEEKAAAYRKAIIKKNEITTALRKLNFDRLNDHPNITVYTGVASFRSSRKIEVTTETDRLEIEGEDLATLNIKFPPAPRSGQIVAEVKEAGMSFGAKHVFSGADFTIERGQKIALVGRNGEGKTTFARMLIGQLAPTEGSIRLGANVRVGYYAQNQDDLMEGEFTVYDTLDRVAVGDIRTRLRDILGAFLFRGEEVDKKVKVLSGGERSRLAMARLMLEPYNLLVLDEPTNHMDMRSKDILKRALQKYDGTVVVVSHDREFLDGIVDKVYEFRDGGVKEYLGGIYYFLEKRKLDSLRDVERKEAPAPAAAPKTEAPKLTYEQKKEQEKLLRKLRRAVESIETELAETERRIADYDARFAAATAYDEADYKAYDDLKAHYDHLMHEWEKASYELEITENG